MNPKTRNLFVRTASGIVYVALMVAAVFTPWVAVPLAAFFIVVGAYEYFKLCSSPDFQQNTHLSFFLKWVIIWPLWIVLPLCLLFLVWIPKQPVPVLAFFILIWMSDTAAYVFGSLFGKHKLAPNISPGKTWEGFLSSCVFTAGLAVGLSYIPYFQSAGLALWTDGRLDRVVVQTQGWCEGQREYHPRARRSSRQSRFHPFCHHSGVSLLPCML